MATEELIMSQRITEEQKDKAIEVYAQKGNLLDAAKAVNLSTKTLLRERQRNSVFRKAMEEARLEHCEYIEQDVLKAANNPNIKQPQLLAKFFRAKRHIPEYRDKVDHSVEGNIKIITGVPRPK